jgi:O-antigen ligase
MIFTHPKYAIWVTLLFIFLGYSGLIKWVPGLFVDPTIISAGIFFMIIIYKFPNFILYDRELLLVIVPFLLLVTWYCFTSLYTLSAEFYIQKVRALQLSFLVFLTPILFFKDFIYFTKLKEVFIVFNLCAVTVLGYLYFSDNLIVIFTKDLSSKIPDYLTIGSFLAICFLINIDKTTFFHVILKVITLLSLIILGGRGPVIFLVLCGFLYYTNKYKYKILHPKSIAVIIMLIVGIFFVINEWEGAELIKIRFENFENDDVSALDRIDQYNTTLNLIKQYPFLGIGIGSFGMYYLHEDINAYPHNLFLEIMIEAGILGFLCLFAIYIFYIYLAFKYRSDYLSMIFFVVTMFVILNYMKSGGFIDSRRLFIWLGFHLAYLNLLARTKLINK